MNRDLHNEIKALRAIHWHWIVMITEESVLWGCMWSCRPLTDKNLTHRQRFYFLRRVHGMRALDAFYATKYGEKR